MPSNPHDSQPHPSIGVVVLGMHRCGTSVLARALIALGVDFGGSFVDAEPDNPKGFFEDKDINSLNVSLLRAMSCQWYTLLLPAHGLTATDTQFGEQARALLKSKFAERRLWGLKEPRITRLLPFWKAAIADINAKACYVLANRNPLSVADSLANRDDIPQAHALALWALHQIDGLAAIIENGGIVVDYDLMMNQPATEMSRLAQFLGQSIDVNRGRSFEEDFLQQDLRHSHHTRKSSVTSPLLEACMELHGSLVALAHTSGPLPHEQFPQAREALSRAKRSMDLHREWFLATDAIYSKVEHAKQELRDVQAIARNLDSKLSKATQVGSSEKIIKSVRRIFSRPGR